MCHCYKKGRKEVMSYHLIQGFKEKIGFEIQEGNVVLIEFNPSITISDEDTPISILIKNQITEYLSKKNKFLTFPVKTKVSYFTSLVLDALRNIQYGDTISYQELAEKIGYPKAARAVGNACGKNPIPLYYPCHRVIKKTGELGGFSGGLNIKKWLLSLEKNV